MIPLSKMHFILTIISMSVFVAFSGCSEEEPLGSLATPSIPVNSYLTSFYQNEELLYSFEYDGEKRLSRQIVRFPEGNFVSEFEYNSINKISKMTGVRSGLILEVALYYNSNGQIDSIYSVSDGSPWVINKFLYDDDRQLTRMIEFAPGSRSLVYNDYFWSGEDIVRRETYFPQEDPRLEDKWIIEYDYDTLPNPFKLVYRDVDFHLIDREPISKHNWTSLKIYNQRTGNIFREIDKEYQYLGTGFPYRKRTYVYDNGNRAATVDGVVADFFY